MDDVVAFCVDCYSTIPDRIAEKDPFLQNGKRGVCKFCGGSVVVTYKSEIENIRSQRDSGKIID